MRNIIGVELGVSSVSPASFFENAFVQRLIYILPPVPGINKRVFDLNFAAVKSFIENSTNFFHLSVDNVPPVDLNLLHNTHRSINCRGLVVKKILSAKLKRADPSQSYCPWRSKAIIGQRDRTLSGVRACNWNGSTSGIHRLWKLYHLDHGTYYLITAFVRLEIEVHIINLNKVFLEELFE